MYYTEQWAEAKKVYSQQEFLALPLVKGRKFCPTGNYSAILNFPANCDFGNGSIFKGSAHFGEGCTFGGGCVFSGDHYFSQGCSFGGSCTFIGIGRFCKDCTFGYGSSLQGGDYFINPTCTFSRNCTISGTVTYVEE